MSDLISRQAAIDAVDEALTRVFVEHRDIAEKMINNVPSAQPEIIRCKDCKNWDRTWKSERPNYHYCPIIDGIRNGFWYCADGDRRGICNE